MGKNAEAPKVKEVEKSNKTEIDSEKVNAEKNGLKKAADSDKAQVEMDLLTPEQAKKRADWIVEKKETKDDVEMLKDIIKAFDEDKETWKLAHLRSEYEMITNKIMASYNTTIQKEVEKNNSEDMGNKDNVEFSNFFSESEERSWDSGEWVNTLNGDKELARRLSDEAMKPQPSEVLGQISDINQVLEKWSEEHKQILQQTILDAENAITNLYNKVSWLDNIDDEL